MTPFFRASAVNTDGDRTDELPAFISFDEASKLFEVSTTSFNDTGVYDLGVEIGYEEFPMQSVFCPTSVKVTYQASFKTLSEPLSDQTISCEDTAFSMNVPQYVDVFNNPANMTVDLGASQSFLEYDEVMGEIKSHV